MSPEERQRHARLRALAARRRSGEPHLTFTARAAGLALALCIALLTLAYPLKEYFGQRGQIDSARAQAASLEKQVADLTSLHAAAQTDAQVEKDARERLHYTFPGQQTYVVAGPTPEPPKPAETKQGNAKVPVNPNSTWYQRLWDSDVAASK